VYLVQNFVFVVSIVLWILLSKGKVKENV